MARSPAHHRPRGLGAPHPGGALRAPRARRCSVQPEQCASGAAHARQGGVDLDAVHRACGDVLRLLRDARRPHLPHDQLCAGVRHSDRRCGFVLQPRGSGRARRAHRVRHHGRPPRCEARADRGALHPGARRGQLRVRQSPRRVLRGRRGVRLCLRRRDAALRGARARLLRTADHGHGAWRGGDGVEPRHGDRSLDRRLALRHVRQLCAPLYLLVRHRRSRSRPRRCARRSCDRHRIGA